MEVLASPVAIILAILALGILIVVHEGGHFLVARLSGMRVDRFSIGFGPVFWKKKVGETTYQIAAIPLGGFVQIAGLNPGEEGISPTDPRSYPNRPVWQRFATILAGPATNYLFALVIITFTFLVFGVPVEGKQPLVGKLTDGMPAATAGLMLEDEIKSINGTPITEDKQVSQLINSSNGAPVTIEVLRLGKPKTFTVTPTKAGEKWVIGILVGHKPEWAKPAVGERLSMAVKFPIERTAMIVQGLFAVKGVGDFSGPPGIVREMKKQIQMGPSYGLWVVAVISVALGLFNLLPLPALDGGRLIFIMWEAISRRRVNEKLEQAVHTVGMFALLGFMLYVMVANDILGKH
jgi:regulator of sigma E protease